MARKRPIEDLPPDSSSDDEVEESSAEDALEDGEEEEETPLNGQKTGSDSESDSDKYPPSPDLSDFTIKPIVTKPQKSAPKPKSVGSLESSSKRKKPPSSASNGSAGNVKTAGIPRVWSEADEIALLKGMTEYKSTKGSDPYEDSSGFLDFIKPSIQADVSKSQLTEKIRRLKKKYENNAGKGENGDDPVFSKPHEYLSFELSKKIWGNETNKKIEKSQKKMKTLGSEDQVKSGVTLGLPCFKNGTEVEEEKVNFFKQVEHMRAYLEKLAEEMGGVIGRDKWSKKLRIKELELYLMRLELIQELAQAALDQFKGSEI